MADDVSPQPVEAGDEPIVIALAAAQALERRAIEDGKRGVKTLPGRWTGGPPSWRSGATARGTQTARPRRLPPPGLTAPWEEP